MTSRPAAGHCDFLNIFTLAISETYSPNRIHRDQMIFELLSYCDPNIRSDCESDPTAGNRPLSEFTKPSVICRHHRELATETIKRK